jgi:hypothetical protein
LRPLAGAAVLAITCAALLSASPAVAYKIGDGTYRWPHPPLPPEAPLDFSVITYFDASDFSWSVERAAAAWNRARTGYQFVSVGGPFGAAVIFTGRPSPRDSCDAHTKPGFPKLGPTFLQNFPRYVPLRGRCDRYLMTLVAAHELGHVLGLSHVKGTCALMTRTQGHAPGGRFATPLGCPTFPRREWWRHPVRPDDIRGVKKLYYDDVYDPNAPL